MDPWVLFLDSWVVVRELSWNAELLTGVTGATSSVTTGAATHWWQLRKSRVLPTLPSHVEAMSEEAEAATKFFASVHELTMSVTEAWNAVRSRRAGGDVESAIRRDALAKCRDDIVEHEKAVRVRLAAYSRAADGLQNCILNFREVWSYSSRDNYRTETYTVTTTDSKGKTRTETRTRQVYESTDHWFTFDRNAATRSRAEIKRWLLAFDDVTFPLLHVHKNLVDIERLSKAEKSFLERLVKNTVLEDPEATVDDADLKHWANQWVLGTRVDAQLTGFIENRRWLSWGFDGVFQKLMASDASYHFRTSSRSHSGPEGYQQHARAMGWMRSASDSWASVSTMLRTCVASANQLVTYAEDPSIIEGDREYAKLAVTAYEAAFPDSEIEVDQLASYGWTIGLGLGAGAAVAALTWAVHPSGLALFL